MNIIYLKMLTAVNTSVSFVLTMINTYRLQRYDIFLI